MMSGMTWNLRQKGSGYEGKGFSRNYEFGGEQREREDGEQRRTYNYGGGESNVGWEPNENRGEHRQDEDRHQTRGDDNGGDEGRSDWRASEYGDQNYWRSRSKRAEGLAETRALVAKALAGDGDEEREDEEDEMVVEEREEGAEEQNEEEVHIPGGFPSPQQAQQRRDSTAITF